jgi:hypothetical protein
MCAFGVGHPVLVEVFDASHDLDEAPLQDHHRTLGIVPTVGS